MATRNYPIPGHPVSLPPWRISGTVGARENDPDSPFEVQQYMGYFVLESHDFAGTPIGQNSEFSPTVIGTSFNMGGPLFAPKRAYGISFSTGNTALGNSIRASLRLPEDQFAGVINPFASYAVLPSDGITTVTDDATWVDSPDGPSSIHVLSDIGTFSPAKWVGREFVFVLVMDDHGGSGLDGLATAFASQDGEHRTFVGNVAPYTNAIAAIAAFMNSIFTQGAIYRPKLYVVALQQAIEPGSSPDQPGFRNQLATILSDFTAAAGGTLVTIATGTGTPEDAGPQIAELVNAFYSL